MIPNIPSLSIHFDIHRTTSGSYCVECWHVLWSVTSPEELRGASLYAGNITISGVAVFCLAVQGANSRVLEHLKEAVVRSDEYKKICATPMFLEGSGCWGLPLPRACRIDLAGNLLFD